MKAIHRKILHIVAIAAAMSGAAHAQPSYLDRLSTDNFAVLPPAARVVGAPGKMRVTQSSCQALPMNDVRRRIVDIAIQEWAFFGFHIVDQTVVVERPFSARNRQPWRRVSWLDVDESARVADSIAGYWAITSDGSWILSRQNEMWNGPSGIAARWRDPWSAAFVSWVMCESGLAEQSQFHRAIAHHTYIDQAIEARDEDMPRAAFAAYDVGEQAVEAGDLLCTARRPTYHSIEERRDQLGDGVRSHCDIVVKVEPERQRILTIGGNVRGTVSMKFMPADFSKRSEDSAPMPQSIGRGRSTIFAHLKLRAASIETDALDHSPTLQALAAQGKTVERLD